MKHSYSPLSFWEHDHSSVSDSQAQEGFGIRTIGGGDNALEASYLYRLRESALRKAISRSLENQARPTHAAHHIFELGCGSGYWVPRLSHFFQKPIRYHGADISKTAISRLQSKYHQCDFSHLDGTTEAWDPILSVAPFSFVFAIDVLYHITDDTIWGTSLQHLMKIVEPGGHFIFSDYGYAEPRSSPSRSHVKHRPMQEYFDQLDAGGFEFVSLHPQFFFFNRIKYGSLRDHGALIWAIWKVADRSRVALGLLYLLETMMIPLLRPLDPRSKSRVFVFKKTPPSQ